MRIDVYLHTVDDSGISGKLDRILSQLELLMAVADDIKKALANLDTETTAIGANIAALAARIKNGMSDQEVADIQASFGVLSDRLTALAADPTVPVPPPSPALQALRRKI